MIRQAAFVLCSVIGVAQVPQQDPFDAASQAYFQARQKGQYDVATAQRERMNQLLQTVAPDDPQLEGRAQRLAQFYENDGMSATGRTILEGALARAEAANAPGQARASLSLTLASFWERDRNLLKSLASLEKAAAILEQTPAADEPAQTGNRPSKGWFISGNARPDVMVRPGVISVTGLSRGGANIYGLPTTVSRISVYTQLADLYQRLGRRDQAAAVLAKMKALPAQSNNWNLAQYYQQHGDLEEAAAIYRKQMEDSASDPQQMLFPAQSLASMYEQMQRPDEAAAVLRETIAALDGSGKPELAAQSSGLRERLAIMLYRSGHAEAADQAFPLPADNGPGATMPVLNYVNYLGMTQRAARGETLLADYLTSHPGLNPGEQTNILFSLANLASMTGDSKRAEEYRLEGSQKLQPKDPPADVVRIGPALQKAQSEANTGSPAEAITLATQAIAQSRNAQDRESLARIAPSVANTISSKSPVQADELYRNVIDATQSWSADTMEPWLTALAGYPRFLMSLQRQWRSASGDRALSNRAENGPRRGHGLDGGAAQTDHRPGAWTKFTTSCDTRGPESDRSGGDSGRTHQRAVVSVPHETLAQLYRSTGDSARALPLYQQMIAIGDAVFRTDDARRGQSRANAATLLIGEHRPDEAEALVLEAMQLRKPSPGGGRDQLTQLLDQIHAMKKAQ